MARHSWPIPEDPGALDIVAGGVGLRIRLVGRRVPDAETARDRDAIDAVVSVEAHPFSGEFHTTVWSEDLDSLRTLLRELGDMVGTSARRQFELREATLRIAFELDQCGHVVVRVEAREDAAESASLLFAIHTEQAYLPVCLESVERALKTFPSRR